MDSGLLSCVSKLCDFSQPGFLSLAIFLKQVSVKKTQDSLKYFYLTCGKLQRRTGSRGLSESIFFSGSDKNHGLLGVACACMVLLVEGLVARNAPIKLTAGGSCKLKEVTNLTRLQMEDSLSNFDEANGEHLGTWPPGFPDLEVHFNSILNASKVVCSLTFMAEGLEKILEDQENDLNPTDILLHDILRETIARVKMLKNCMRHSFKSECPKEILPPKMPEYTFERKQWCHTLLMSAEKYLGWLQRKITDRKGKKTLHASSTDSKYLEGSIHHL